MTSRGVVGVLVAALGVALAVYGAYGVASGLGGSNGGTDTSPQFAALAGGFSLGIGLLLALLGTGLLAARRRGR
jgi:hypothetical protein